MLLSHDDAVARAREAARAFTPERAASLFVATLDRDRARQIGRAHV